MSEVWRAPIEGEQLAVISEVGFGMRDTDSVVLWFTVYIDEVMAALQLMDVDGAVELIKAYHLDDVQDLNGRLGWVKRDGNIIRWVRPALIPVRRRFVRSPGA